MGIVKKGKRKADNINSSVSSKRIKRSRPEENKYVQDKGKTKAASRWIYSDFKGYYVPEIGEKLVDRFEVLSTIGRGTFGIVVLAKDHKDDVKVAIKILRRGGSFSSQRLSEIKIYEYISSCYGNNHAELSCMKQYFSFRDLMFIVLELCGEDMSNIWQNKEWVSDKSNLKSVIRCIARGLVQLHRIDIIHCDIKADNIAFREGERNKVKIIDLGNSQHGNQQCRPYGALHYRAPEVILHLAYGPGVDVWALACTAFKLVTGQTLFKGKTPFDHFASIIEVLGLPPPEMIRRSHVQDRFFNGDGSPKYCSPSSNEPSTNKAGLGRVMPGKNDVLTNLNKDYPDFVDFLRKSLMWDPKQRLTATEILCHKWLLPEEISIERVKARQNDLSYTRKIKSDPHLDKRVENVFSQAHCQIKLKACGQKLPYRTVSSMNNQHNKDNNDLWLMVQAKFLNNKL